MANQKKKNRTVLNAGECKVRGRIRKLSQKETKLLRESDNRKLTAEKLGIDHYVLRALPEPDEVSARLAGASKQLRQRFAVYRDEKGSYHQAPYCGRYHKLLRARLAYRRVRGKKLDCVGNEKAVAFYYAQLVGWARESARR